MTSPRMDRWRPLRRPRQPYRGDRRYAGPGFQLLGALYLVGSNLDRSDHAPFWNGAVPCVVVTDTAPMRDPRYHHATDTAVSTTRRKSMTPGPGTR